MPNQSDPNQNQQTDTPQGTVNTPVQNDSPIVIPDIPVAEDIPPVSDDVPPTPITDSPITDLEKPEIPDLTNSSIPPEIPPVISTTPKKKFGGGKIIATILGFLILAGGIIGGVVLTKQQQDIREKAFIPEGTGGGSLLSQQPGAYNPATEEFEDEADGSCPGGAERCNGRCVNTNSNENNCGSCNNRCTTGQTCQDGTCTGGGSTACNTTVPGIDCSTGETCTITDGYNPNSANDQECVVKHYWCQGITPLGQGCNTNLIGTSQSESFTKDCGTEQIDVGCAPKGVIGSGCYTDSSYKKTWISKRHGEPCVGDGGGGGTSTTNPPSAQCQAIRAYKPTTSAQLTATELSQLKTGDQVRFCVSGGPNSKEFTKAKFTINGNVGQETTTPTDKGMEPFIGFCQLYTIPAGTTTFQVTAQVFHPTLGWK